MLRDEGVAMIKQQLAFRQTLDSEIVTNLQSAQTLLEINPTKPWFMYSDYTPFVTVSGANEIAVPDDFIEEIDDEGLTYIPADTNEEEVQLVKDEYDVLKKYFRSFDYSSETASPQGYALLGEKIIVFPTPDAVYNLGWRYVKRQVSLTTNVENNWLKWVPHLLLGAAGKQIALGPLRDKIAAGVFDEWIAAGMTLMSKQNTSRDMQNRIMQMGGPHA